ncbi:MULTISPECIES: hypothetical protein [unclassified Knoellia]|uniref:hypothetical protein n=1 Tax=Knoellia altitudinis TaxID=3404795 RepID=UPI00360DEF56
MSAADPLLPPSPFTLDDARSIGLTPTQWRNPDLIRVTRGVKATAEIAEFEGQCRAFALALPDDVAFSHLTAARLWGLPLPSWAEAAPGFDVMRNSGRAVIERHECRGHRGLERRHCRTVRGLDLTSIADTLVDLAEVRRPQALSADDLVVLADAVLMRLAEQIEVRPGEEEWEAVARFDMERGDGAPRLDRHDVLHRALDRRVRPRGAKRLRLALGLARVGSRSPMETRSRLLFVRRGFPEPELNATLTGPGGRLLEGDFVWRDQKVIGEYQGAHHGGRRQRSVDVARRDLAEDDGWRMVEFWAKDVHQATRRRTFLRRLAGRLGLDLESLDLS